MQQEVRGAGSGAAACSAYEEEIILAHTKCTPAVVTASVLPPGFTQHERALRCQ